MIQNAQFRDRANGLSVGGKSVISKVPNKSGRKPLGEISNSNLLKPQHNHVAQKQQKQDEKGFLNSTIPLNGKKSVSKSMKNFTPAARKPLGDISNSRKPGLPQVSQKKKDKSVNVLEHCDPGIDEGFLHNHAECIKTQRQAVDMYYFLETIGHCTDSSFNKGLYLPSLTEEANEEDMDLSIEMPELLSEESYPLRSKADFQMNHKLSPPCKSPQSPTFLMQCGNADSLDCCLAETPTILLDY